MEIEVTDRMMVEQALKKVNEIATKFGMTKQDVIDLGFAFMVAYEHSGED